MGLTKEHRCIIGYPTGSKDFCFNCFHEENLRIVRLSKIEKEKSLQLNFTNWITANYDSLMDQYEELGNDSDFEDFCFKTYEQQQNIIEVI